MSKREPIYRIRYTNNRYGPMWYAEPRPGYDRLMFPVILGGETLAPVIRSAINRINLARIKYGARFPSGARK